MNAPTGDTGSQGTSQDTGSPQPNQPTQGTDQAGAGSGSDSQDAPREGSRGFAKTFADWFRGGPSREELEVESQDGSDGAAGERPGQPKPGGAKQPTAQKPAARVNPLEGDPNEQLTMTREEYRRSVQSAKDSQIAEENRRNAELARTRATAAQYARLRELADPQTGDPDKLMEEVNALLQQRETVEVQQARQEEINGHIRSVADRWDSEILYPLMDRLPKDVATRIENEAPQELTGIPHRAHVFAAAIEALVETARKEGEANAKRNLRSNEAFRRVILHDDAEQRPEPELVVASAPSNGHADPNTALRRFLGR